MDVARALNAVLAPVHENGSLPSFAPELNPVELLWSYLKGNRLADCAPADVTDIHRTAHRPICRLLLRCPLLRVFLAGTPRSPFPPAQDVA